VELPVELEDAISAAPDDREAYLVAADWLQDRGAFQGELVVGDDRERAIALLPPAIRGESAFTVEWRWGFVRGVLVASMKDANEPRLLRELLESPIARFVQKLVLQGTSARLVDALFEAAQEPRALRCLRTLMVFMDDGAHAIDLARLPPTLRRLVVRGAATGTLAQPDLVELALDRVGSEVVREVSLPALEMLHISRPFDAIEPNRWLDPERLPALRRLTLATLEETIDRRVWSESRIARQLELLDIFDLTPGRATQRFAIVDRAPPGDAGLLELVGPERGTLHPMTHPIHGLLQELGGWFVTRITKRVFVNGHDVTLCSLRSLDELAIGERVYRFLQGDVPALAAQLRTRYGL
jgi:uncharacterized protein (TIGR02996 family)